MLKIFRFRQKFKIDLINTIQTYASSEKKTATDYYNVLGLRPGCTEE